MKIKKRKATLKTITILILGFMLNFLFAVMPNEFKETVSGFANGLGVSYSLFWIIITSPIFIAIVIFVWKKALAETETTEGNRKTVNKNKRVIKQLGEKPIFIGKNKGDINVN